MCHARTCVCARVCVCVYVCVCLSLFSLSSISLLSLLSLSSLSSLSSLFSLSLSLTHSLSLSLYVRACVIFIYKHRLFMWGKGDNGRLGNGSLANQLVPTQVNKPSESAPRWTCDSRVCKVSRLTSLQKECDKSSFAGRWRGCWLISASRCVIRMHSPRRDTAECAAECVH